MKTYNLFLICRFSSILCDNLNCNISAENVNGQINAADIQKLRKYRDMIHATGDKQMTIAIDKEPLAVRSAYVYSPFSNDDMLILKYFENLESLEIRSSEVTDVGLKVIPELKKIQRLDFSNLPITDEGIKNVISSSSLKNFRKVAFSLPPGFPRAT